jgi:hypothetical protein
MGRYDHCFFSFFFVAASVCKRISNYVYHYPASDRREPLFQHVTATPNVRFEASAGAWQYESGLGEL